ncbi:LytTR family DNA-binding domain-containing protein [Flavobacterium sp.]|uniref:LytR/AlgR family response regulator transcription factor n=1 Tax=Flavobacterium sp. TaxID=239 RepID=UPI002486D3BE|nr:LytTR family DNA-binding domain-containing protein [Flavobacterium sp.]MDI1317741.1 LytTR family DNA-binding domain-containing protein [Flavobacterium sp.]
MRCIIIDDEKLSREILSVLIFKSSDLILAEEFSNAIDAIKYLNEDNEVDLIFLDIHMPNFSGIDFIKTIKNPPKVIMVTTDQNFALEAFNYDCINDYLVKPIQGERFDRAVERSKLKKEKKLTSTAPNVDLTSTEIYINIDKRLVKIDISTIKYIHAFGDYIDIITETVNYKVHTSLKKIEEKLLPFNFLRIHRSYIINLNKIIDIQDATALIGKSVIPISRNKRKPLIESLNLL